MLRAMFYFLYDRPYDYASEGRNSDFQFQARVYTVAEKYGIKPLRDKVMKYFQETPLKPANIGSFVRALTAASRLPDSDNTNHPLDSIMYQKCRDHASELMQRRAFRELLPSIPRLAIDMLTHVATPTEEYAQFCEKCKAVITHSYWKRHAELGDFQNPDDDFCIRSRDTVYCPVCTAVVEASNTPHWPRCIFR